MKSWRRRWPCGSSTLWRLGTHFSLVCRSSAMQLHQPSTMSSSIGGKCVSHSKCQNITMSRPHTTTLCIMMSRHSNLVGNDTATGSRKAIICNYLMCSEACQYFFFFLGGGEFRGLEISFNAKKWRVKNIIRYSFKVLFTTEATSMERDLRCYASFGTSSTRNGILEKNGAKVPWCNWH